METTTSKMAQVSIDEKPKSFGRRDHLRELEQTIQQQWEQDKVFESERDPSKPKYMCTFPYPYMNGFMHIGHGFALSKAEFAGRYHRLKGENVLFPLAFHCTGMPIQAAANKLKHEIDTYGCPPDFSKDEAVVAEKEESKAEPDNKAKGKKSKLAAKTGKVVRQWDILKMMVPEGEIPKFQDPLYWLHYFPPHAQKDLRNFGVNIDWRRSFITTDVNPYYDAFIQWQLNKLNARNRVNRGKRPNVYSALDQQICADHDRSSGEGVNPQEYTIVKLRVVEPFPEKLAPLQGKNVYLAPATLRPETMYGQTNCFVLPEGDYGAYVINDDNDVLIISQRAAKNLAHQEYSRTWGKEECLLELKGTDLLGLPLKAPNAKYDVVYTLPLLTISMGKGTGVVTSVPSDAPDDFAALRDLKEKPALREKYGIEEHMVMPYDPVPIIDIPGYGDLPAQTVCDELKIKSQNDKDKLAKAKELVYLKGFYEGVLLVGSQKGQKVCDAKPVVRQELLKSNDAIPYWETESLVMSRTGDECVVAHLDQWYLTYGADDWKERVLNHIRNPETFTAYTPSALLEYEQTLGWLREWAPCRQFGLGTKLPWDPQFVVESLSDSTIYMAFYTIAHLLQANIDGSKPGSLNITASDLTADVFEYIFCKGLYPSNCAIPEAALTKCREEFEYWYPLDLRVSGKDLIRNHLTMCLYNHAEIWADDQSKWPRSFYTNGHVQVDAEKMSKSKGNFLSLDFCIKEWGADASRFACADAGDSMDDSNFSRETANMAILRLTTEEEWIKSVLNDINANALRTTSSSEYTFNDKIFLNQMYSLIEQTKQSYENLLWREGLRTGFFEFSIARDTYRDICNRSKVPMHRDIILKFIEWQYIILSPICPHMSEQVWKLLGKDGYVCRDARWPEVETVDHSLLRAGEYLNKALKNFRKNMVPKKGKNQTEVKKFTHAHVYVATEFPKWQQIVLNFMATHFNASTKSFNDEFMKEMKKLVGTEAELKPHSKKVMKFAAFVKAEAQTRGAEALELTMSFDEIALMEANKTYFIESLDLVDLKILDVKKIPADEPHLNERARDLATPGEPTLSAYAL